ncbi:MAG: hypothetical protein QM569_03185 [Acidovorax sp.]|uniref:hypothetical protein n=1 Tax=Acidovorax sp. TaxID=1872122 RepID=UPI0039E6B269
MPIDHALNTLDQELDRVVAVLASGDAPLLEQASAQLRDAVMQCSVALQSHARPLSVAVRRRFDAQRARLVVLRDQMARVSAVAEAQLAAIVPAAAATTYGPGARPSGGAAARIYRAAG